MRTSFSGIGDEWVATDAERGRAARTRPGKPDTPRALSDADRKAVIDGSAQCLRRARRAQGRHGVRPDRLPLRSGTLVCCKGAKADGCLSPAQAAAIAKAFAGPKDSKGRQVYPGFLYDTGIAVDAGAPGSARRGYEPRRRRRSRPPRWTWTQRAAAAAADPQMRLTSTSAWTNLNTFSGHGGKLIFYHGVSDPWFSALDTLDYYERMTKANGGRRPGHELEPPLPGAGHGPLRRRAARSTPSTCSARSSSGSRRVRRRCRSPRPDARSRAAAVRCAPTRSTPTTRAAGIPIWQKFRVPGVDVPAPNWNSGPAGPRLIRSFWGIDVCTFA